MNELELHELEISSVGSEVSEDAATSEKKTRRLVLQAIHRELVNTIKAPDSLLYNKVGVRCESSVSRQHEDAAVKSKRCAFECVCECVNGAEVASR